MPKKPASNADNSQMGADAMLKRLAQHPHNKLMLTHTTGLGFDASIWELIIDGTVYSSVSLEGVLRKATDALHIV